MTKYPITIKEIQAGLKAGEFSAVELTTAVFENIEQVDPKIKGFLALNKEEALEQAKASDERGYGDDAPALNGVPIAIKDNILTKDLETTAASKMLEGFIPPFDATVVEKLKDAGAVIIGKTNLDEFAMGGTTETSYYQNTHNAWDQSCVPGGSSGGSAAVVASRQVPAALGSDTGGSIRQPAAFNGLVGLKPTYGAVSRYGAIGFGSSFDQVGPLTLTVEDNAKLLEVIAGVDEKDMTSLPTEKYNYTEKLGQDIKGLKIAVPKAYLLAELQAEVKASLDSAIEYFKSQGAIVEEVELDLFEEGTTLYHILASAEASTNLGRFDGIRYGYRSPDANSLDEIYVQSRTEGFGPEVQKRIVRGTYILSGDGYHEYFEKAAKVRTLLAQEYKEIFEDYDMILGPTTVETAYKLGEKYDEKLADLNDALVVSANLAGIPALSFLAGFDGEDLPIGLQLIGPANSEASLYQVADNFEKAHDYVNKAPNL